MSETQAAEAAAKAPDTRPDTRQVGAGELKDLAAKFQDLLKIRTLPIGMKQFETVEAMEAIPGLRRPKPGRFHTTCQLVTQARMAGFRSEEHTSELQSLMRISYAVFRLKYTINIYVIYS